MFVCWSRPVPHAEGHPSRSAWGPTPGTPHIWVPWFKINSLQIWFSFQYICFKYYPLYFIPKLLVSKILSFKNFNFRNSFWVPLCFHLVSDFNFSTNTSRIPINIWTLPHLSPIPQIFTPISVRETHYFQFQIYPRLFNSFYPILLSHDHNFSLFKIVSTIIFRFDPSYSLVDVSSCIINVHFIPLPSIPLLYSVWF